MGLTEVGRSQPPQAYQIMFAEPESQHIGFTAWLVHTDVVQHGRWGAVHMLKKHCAVDTAWHSKDAMVCTDIVITAIL